MKKLFYVLWLIFIFPVDLFRFTTDAWMYTFEMISYRLINGHCEQPCKFCRGLDLGMVPRRVSSRIKYHNLWMVKCFQKDLVFQAEEGRMRPKMACMNEGGFVRLSWYVPVLAILLGLAWNVGLIWVLWVTSVIPEPVKAQIIECLT